MFVGKDNVLIGNPGFQEPAGGSEGPSQPVLYVSPVLMLWDVSS